jgi:GntR family transcriptional repressor for pyruvate dehydrogenase complex
MRYLIGEIVSGHLTEGQLLPREQDLVHEFAVSRGVVREVVRGLEERGLVVVTHGRGAEVTQAGQWSRFHLDVLVALLRSDRGEQILGECMQSLRIAEIAAVGLAVERVSDEGLAKLADAAAATRYPGANIQFHRALVDAAANEMLTQIVVRIHQALMQAIASGARTGAERALGPEGYGRIVSAIAAGNSRAAREAMGDHLGRLERWLSACLPV